MFNHFAFRLAGVIVPLAIIGTVGTLFLTGGEAQAVDATEDHAATRPATRPADDGYPVSVCPVTGEALGSMGEPPAKVIDGRLVKFCCEGCIPAFEKEPEKYHAKLDNLIIDATEEAYPLDECLVVPADGLGENAVTAVHRPTNQVVKFCCGSCEVKFNEDPQKYLAKLDEAKQPAE